MLKLRNRVQHMTEGQLIVGLLLAVMLLNLLMVVALAFLLL